MASKNTVTLDFAGDTKKLEKSFDKVESSAKDMKSGVEKQSTGLKGLFDKIGFGANDMADNIDGATTKSSKSFSKIGTALGGLALGGIAAAGAAVGMAFTMGMENYLDKVDATLKLKANLGRSGNFEDLGKEAGRLWASGFTGSISEASDVIIDVQRALGGLGDGMMAGPDFNQRTGELRKFVNEWGASWQQMGVDAGEVTRSVAQMVRTGMVGSVEEGMDLVTVALNKLGPESDILEVLSEYSVHFKKLGIDGPTAIGLISQAMQAGARNADLVGDAIKEFTIRAQDGSTATAGAFEDLGLSAQEFGNKIAEGGPKAREAFDTVLSKLREVEDPVKRNTIGVGLFGTQWEDLQTAFDAMDTSTALEQLGSVKGAAKDLTTTVADNQTEWDKFKNKMSDVLGNVFEEWSGFANWMLENVWTKVWNGASDFISNLDTLPGKFGRIFGDMASTAGQKAGEVVGFMARLPGNILAALGSVGTLLWNTGRNLIQGLISGVGSMIGSLYNSITNALSGLVSTAKRALGIGSPSKVFAEEIGRWIPEGIAVGIDANTDSVTKSLGELTNPMNLDMSWRGNSGGQSASGSGSVSISFAGNVDGAFATAFMGLVRKGAIQVQVT